MRKIILKNLRALFSAQILVSLITPILYILIARNLGDEIFGKYSFIFSLTAIMLIVAEYGLKSVASRDVARDFSLAGRYLGATLILKFFFSTLSGISLIFIVKALHMPRDTTLASSLFAGGMFFLSMSFSFRWVFQAFQKMKYEALLRVGERGILLILSVFVLWKGRGLIALSMAYLVTNVLIFFLSLISLNKVFKLSQIRFDFSLLKYIAITSTFFALSEMFWSIYFKIDQVMLAKLRNETEVGWYNASYVIVSFITLIAILSMQALFPVFSYLYKTEREKLKNLVGISFRYLFFAGSITVPIIFTFSGKIINLIYGSGYSKSITALRVLIFAIFFLLPGHLFGTILATTNRHKIFALLNFMGAAINVILNLILIPRLGYVGAGAATIVTEASICILFYLTMARFLRIDSARIILKSLPGLAAMVLSLYLLRTSPIAIALILSLAIYLLLSFRTGFLRKEDLSLFVDLIRKNLPFLKEDKNDEERNTQRVDR